VNESKPIVRFYNDKSQSTLLLTDVQLKDYNKFNNLQPIA